MANDLSRIRMDPLSHYAGVELRQGAVLLDADANESSDIADRRLRALASDVLGRARVSSTTPDAFRITLSGTPPMLTIGKGRLYVDGLLAENHGSGAVLFDPLLGDVARTDAIAYDRQPFLLDPPALPTAGRHIVYLDTWHRTVTHVEAPGLTEIAVGVETSARIQAAWQVRVVEAEVPADATCETADATWSALIAPSTGVLTTGTFENPAVVDPCELPPSGGYRGLENQLYRVEIHVAGTPGAGATFKWSRENASIAVPVEAWVSDTELRLQSLGRDDVLGFQTGDWVEITDDAQEFLRQPGQMRRIAVDRATRHISFTDALPAAFNTDPTGRHLRVVRWDQAAKVFALDGSGAPVQVDDLDSSATGTIAVPAAGTTLLLENGITVAFDAEPGAGFRTGDYWVFAARTADASVELLHRAPARGTHHHFARLALWDAGTGALTDCRQAWPPPTGGDDCACTVCVKPRDAKTLPDAIAKIRANGGGTLCLDIGEYVLDDTLVIGRVQSLRIVGKGSGTILRTQRGPGVLRIEEGSRDVVLSAFALAKGHVVSSQPLLAVLDSGRVGLDRLTFHGEGGDITALALGNRIDGLWMEDCDVATPLGIAAIERGAHLVGVRIENNAFACVGNAIALNARCEYEGTTRVAGNRIACEKSVALALNGTVGPDASVEIEDNHVLAPSGIESTLNRQRIAHNTLQSTREAGGGIQLTAARDTLDDQMVLGNRLEGYAEAIVVKASLHRMLIQHNQIAAVRNGITISGAEVDKLSISHNQLRVPGAALRVEGRTGSVAIAGNQVEALRQATSINVQGRAMTCQFDANQCTLMHARAEPAVLLRAHSVQAATNRIRGDGGGDGLISLQVDAVAGMVFGNIVKGAIQANFPMQQSNIENAPD